MDIDAIKELAMVLGSLESTGLRAFYLWIAYRVLSDLVGAAVFVSVLVIAGRGFVRLMEKDII